MFTLIENVRQKMADKREQLDRVKEFHLGALRHGGHRPEDISRSTNRIFAITKELEVIEKDYKKLLSYI